MEQSRGQRDGEGGGWKKEEAQMESEWKDGEESRPSITTHAQPPQHSSPSRCPPQNHHTHLPLHTPLSISLLYSTTSHVFARITRVTRGSPGGNTTSAKFRQAKLTAASHGLLEPPSSRPPLIALDHAADSFYNLRRGRDEHWTSAPLRLTHATFSGLLNTLLHAFPGDSHFRIRPRLRPHLSPTSHRLPMLSCVYISVPAPLCGGTPVSTERVVFSAKVA
ncbi:hypothetical protein E2C01_037917 [Portunus trituberculatus]|uniref:Uncharacterized protein n=1 Tax=Portunus trituberculatus TaxID=210409 RepID=A0A5B7FH44_PORTR|nr:hypothetical protein [Portunus trituberculatus]